MQFKFITLNLWHGGELFDNILDFLNKERPDIFVAQEVYNGKDGSLERRFRAFSVLQKKLDFKHSAFAPALTDNREEGKLVHGNAIFSRYFLSPAEITFYDLPYNDHYIDKEEAWPTAPRNLQHVLIQIRNSDSVIPNRHARTGRFGTQNVTVKNQLNLFNTHGIWGEDGDDSPRRFNMVQTIINKIQDKDKVVLAGDFNLKEQTEAVKKIENHLTNIFKGELKTTFNMKRKDQPSFATAIVDMVFISDDIKVVEYYCPQVDISDHLPLVCVFEI